MEKKLNPAILILKDGPIMVDGELKIVNSDGNVYENKKCFLCRCGASNNKPFCDGAHKKIDFKG